MKPSARFALFILIVSRAVSADTNFRCGNQLVYEGDSMAKVESLCGTPTQRAHSTLVKPQTFWRDGRPYSLGETIVQVDTWTYNFGPQKFMREMRFEDGNLVRIDALGYGYNEP